MKTDSSVENFRRYEFKYIVHDSLSELIKGDLKEFLEIDPQLKKSKKKSYTVRSLYLDSPSKDYFYEKIDGIKSRKKYRFRTYSSDLSAADTFFLEQKG